jgi:hypothetical protein
VTNYIQKIYKIRLHLAKITSIEISSWRWNCQLIKRFPQSGREWVMHTVFEREEVPAEQVTSRPVDPVEKKPAAAKGKGKGRARKEPAEEELGFPEEGTVSRKRSLSEPVEPADEPSEPAEPAEPATRLRPRLYFIIFPYFILFQFILFIYFYFLKQFITPKLIVFFPTSTGKLQRVEVFFRW